MQSRKLSLFSQQRRLPTVEPSEPPGCKGVDPVKSTAIVLRIDRQHQHVCVCETRYTGITIRESLCALCETLVCIKLDIPLAAMRARTRSSAEVALARQIAMYLAHTSLSIMMTEIGLHFGRDRTTVAHACALVEDRRDELAFDTTVCQLEAAIESAVDELLSDMIGGGSLEGCNEQGMHR